MIIDEIDVKVLKKIQGGDWRGTITELAEDLNVSRMVVQERIQRLEEARIILCYDVGLTPWIHGGEWIWAEAFINLENPSSKHKVVEELKARLNYFEQATTYTVIPSGSSHDISATFHARGEEEYKREVCNIDEIEGVSKINAVILEHMNVSKVELDEKDWEVLRSLKQDIKKKMKDHNEGTGERREEIGRRVNRLIDEKKLFFSAATDFSRIDNWSHIHVKVTFQRNLSQEEILELDAAGIVPPHNDWKRIEKGVLTIEPCSIREFIEKTNKIVCAGMRIRSQSIEDSYLPSQPWMDKY